MKKLIISFLCGVLFTSALNADLLRVEMGLGSWAQTPSGDMSYSDGLGATGSYNSNETSDTNAYAWIVIKHPVPVLPNLRLEYTNVKDSGIIRGSFKDFTVPGASTAGSLELTQYDIIPYYNVLDNSAWITLDLGIDLKILDVCYQAQGVNVHGFGLSNYEDKTSVVVPLLYARSRVEIPGTNIGLEVDGKYLTYDGSTLYDARAKVDYTLSFIPVVQPALEVGYRVQKFDLKDEDGSDETLMNMDFSGFYAGLMLRF